MAYAAARGQSRFGMVDVIPQSFLPDKTLVVPADTGGANVIMESSTDLIHWEAAQPGQYTQPATHLFFRLRVERLP